MHMNDETKAAWEKCVIHWDRLASGDMSEPIGEKSCAFCQRFSTAECLEPDTGERCPVYRATGTSGCSGTPYYEADVEYHHNSRTTLFRREERDFIVGLIESEPVIGEYEHDRTQ